MKEPLQPKKCAELLGALAGRRGGAEACPRGDPVPGVRATAVLESIDGNDGLSGSSATAGGEHLKLALEVVGIVSHSLEIFGRG